MTPEEKVAAIVALVPTRTLSFSQGGINFAVSDITGVGGTLWYYAQAWTGTGNKKVFLPADTDWTLRPYDGSGRGEYGAFNPPLGVPDGGTTTITVPRGRGGSEIVTVATFTRDDITAAKQIVYDAVTGYALRHGWTP